MLGVSNAKILDDVVNQSERGKVFDLGVVIGAACITLGCFICVVIIVFTCKMNKMTVEVKY